MVEFGWNPLVAYWIEQIRGTVKAGRAEMEKSWKPKLPMEVGKCRMVQGALVGWKGLVGRGGG